MKKIKIAFIKFGGLSAGGTEKFLQTIAANLNREIFQVDYFYCDSAPYVNSTYVHADTDQNRVRYMNDHGVNLIKFDVGTKDISTYTHDWKNTNFWDLFDEDNYDLIQTGRAGHPEYPFYKIKKTPIIDSLHTSGGVDNQFNIARVMHITKWSAQKWIDMGGDKNRVVYVSHPMEILSEKKDLKKDLQLEKHFVFGFHQRSDDSIFSDIPLKAYQKIQSEETAFIIMGGSSLYSKQAQDLGLKRFIQLPHSGKPQDIYDFLQTLSVYAHGRKDGELNSTAMAEAMYFGLPIVSHTSPVANGHIECVGEAGNVVSTIESYSKELKRLLVEDDYRKLISNKARDRFLELYDLEGQIKNIEDIYKEVLRNPYPHKYRRMLFHFETIAKRFAYRKFLLNIYRWIKNTTK